MKITRVAIQNYRSLKEVELDIDDYSVFVGSNGAGKSSVLYALQWFFDGHALDVTDVHGLKESDRPDPKIALVAGAPARPTVLVTVTFSDLSPTDKARLVEYGRGETASFSRSWTLGEPKSKVVGNAMAGPGFAPIRAMTRVTEIRPAYATLRQTLTDLPELLGTVPKEEVFQALADWEGLEEHADHNSK